MNDVKVYFKGQEIVGCPDAEVGLRRETDEELLQRMFDLYGWGAFMGQASECRGASLDKCAAQLGLKRRLLSVTTK